MPDAPESLQIGDKPDHDSDIVIVQRDRDLIETLQHELEVRNQEIARLHDVVTAQARAIERVTAAMPVLPRAPHRQRHRRRGRKRERLSFSG